MKSLLAEKIQAALAYRESLGKSTKSYAPYLRNLDAFCAENYPGETCLTKELAWTWVHQASHIKSGRMKNCISAINFLGQYLLATGENAYVFPDSFAPYRYHPHPYVFTDEELSRLFAAADSFPYCPQSPLRHKIVPVVFRLIYTCGLRPGEGRALKKKHINLDTGEVFITDTKFDKDRLIVMSDDMLSLCRKYDAVRAAATSFRQSEYFFPAPGGNCYSRNAFSQMFQQCWKAANPGIHNLPRVRVYDLRHRFASAVLNRWTDEKRDLYAMLPYLRAYMGHYDLSATEHYIHLLPDNLVKSSGVFWAAMESIIPEVEENE